jgi:Na+/H+ antiporter NhaD/arsenite permease-like protein
VQIIIAVILTYIFLAVLYKHRTPIAALGAGVVMLLGHLNGIYPVNVALNKFPLEVLLLILVLSLFSREFETNGLLTLLGTKSASITRGKRHLMLGILLFTVFLFSCFANNLSVTLTFTLICLRLGVALNIPLVPLLVGTVVASNIGGCPLPWADTPAIVVTSYTDFGMMDFVTLVLPTCFLFVILLVFYALAVAHIRSGSLSGFYELTNVESLKYLVNFEKVRWKSALLPMILFGMMLIGISVGPFVGVPVCYVAIPCGALLLLVKGKNARESLDITGMLDTMVFIAALFLIAGALESSGYLQLLTQRFQNLQAVSVVLPSICVLGVAFVASTFLSAGPAAATLLPICLKLSQSGGPSIYVGLVLGILAGSSMAPWSATGGPCMLNETLRFLKEETLDEEERESVKNVLGLGSYIKFSAPFSLVILMLSASWLYLIHVL